MSAPTMQDGEVVVQKDTSHTDVDHEETSINDSSHLTWMMSTIYQLILIMLGIVFSTGILFNRQSEMIYISVQVYGVYLDIVTLAFLLYVHCYLLRQKNSKVHVPDKIVSQSANRDGESSNVWEHHDSTTPDDPSKPKQRVTVPAIMYCDGLNIYLRLGAIVLAVGIVILLSFSLAAAIIDWSFKVWNMLHFTETILRILIIFFQTYFIFTCHGIVINKHITFVRFGLKHMVAVNLVSWCYLLMTEATENFDHYAKTDLSEREVSPGSKNGTDASVKIRQIVKLASPYLYPLAIEYTILCVIMFYKIHGNVGRFQAKMFETIAKHSPQQANCSNGSFGLFLGILVVVTSIISQGAFIILTENFNFPRIPFFVFYATELFVLLIALIGSVVGFLQLHQLRIYNSEDALVDALFLLVFFFIGGLYHVFLVVSSLANVANVESIGILFCAANFLYLIQMVCQLVFIIDGLVRTVGKDSHAHIKPGRGAVTLVLLCNLSLWLIHTTEVKRIKEYPTHSAFYGHLPWSFIQHGCMPMKIFFRFHSTVCLSSISEFAYKKHKLN